MRGKEYRYLITVSPSVELFKKGLWIQNGMSSGEDARRLYDEFKRAGMVVVMETKTIEFPYAKASCKEIANYWDIKEVE